MDDLPQELDALEGKFLYKWYDLGLPMISNDFQVAKSAQSRRLVETLEPEESLYTLLINKM